MADIRLSVEQARECLQKTVDGLRKEAGALGAIRAKHASDHLKMLEEVGPLLATVQFPILTSLGYTADDEGLMHYTSALRANEDDEAVCALMASVHLLVLCGEGDEGDGAVPKLALPSAEITYEEVLLSARGAKK
jgi:hypothetical protein